MQTLLQELRFGARMLLKNPGFTLIAALTLAPGIGATRAGDTSSTQPIAFTHVTVIAMTDAPPQPDMTVLIAGNRIAAMGKTGKLRAPRNAQILDSFSADKAYALFERFVRNKTWQAPTLFTLKRLWDRNDLRDEDLRLGELVKHKELELVKTMHRAGVGLLAGTDGPPDRINLHDELAMFVQAGLTPKEALQTATINPARFLSKQNSLGAIENGKIADLVLLEANPLDDIHNAKKIVAVVVNGQYVTAAALRKILADIENGVTKP